MIDLYDKIILKMDIYEFLDDLKIVDQTVQEAKYIENSMKGISCKNLFKKIVINDIIYI